MICANSLDLTEAGRADGDSQRNGAISALLCSAMTGIPFCSCRWVEVASYCFNPRAARNSIVAPLIVSLRLVGCCDCCEV